MSAPKAKFMTLGKSKFVHVVHTKAYDLKHAQCQQVRKYWVAGKIDPKHKGLSANAASALDPCELCDAKRDINVALKPTAEQRREESKARADEVRERASGKKPRKATKAAKATAKTKTPKPPKERKPSMTKSGVRSVVSGVEDAAKAKAEMLIAHGDEYGWTSTLDKDKSTGHWVVTSKRAGEVIHTYYIDGKYDVARHAEITVGDWHGKLRGAHAVRRQMAMEGRDRPHPEPGKGRSGPRKKTEVDVPEDESPEDARRRVPFSLDDPEIEIIDKIKGKVIKWRNGQSGSIEEAWLPSEWKGKKRDKITITTHPKTEKRMVNFLTVVSVGEHGEVYGPERTVYLDKIVRVEG